MVSFASDMNLSHEDKDTTFEDNLNMRYKGLVIVHRLSTLRKVVDRTKIIEKNKLDA